MPHAELDAADEKNRKGAVIPLRKDLAAELKQRLLDVSHAKNGTSRDERACNESDRRLFTVASGLVRIRNRDLKAAGIPKRDERGRTIDVHALRHSFGTLLSTGGVTPRTAQAAMRHSTIDLTMNVYTDPKLLDVQGALNSLPALDMNSAPPSERQTMRATGTEGWGGTNSQDNVSVEFAPNSGKSGQSVSFPGISSTEGDGLIERAETPKNPKKTSLTCTGRRQGFRNRDDRI